MAKSKVAYWLTEDGLTLIKGWARDGLTDSQIAEKIGISRSTLNEWKNKYPDISDTLKKGKEIVDYEVENALLKRALGYSYKEITKETKWNPTKEEFEMIVSKEVTKEVAPDTTAQIFWLKNRQSQKWRDKPEEKNNNDEDKVVIVNDLPK